MSNLVVIGQGYVGLPLAEGATDAGFTVTGLDLNRSTVASLNSGVSHVDDVSDATLKHMLESGYSASSDTESLRQADVVVICVPTPLGEAGGPDLGAVEAASRSVANNLKPGTLVILESTTYPGTTEDLVLPILEDQGHILENDFFLAFSPERIDPGNPIYGLKNTPKVVGGVTKESTRRAVDFYSAFVDSVVATRGAREAETAKLLENTYRHINIALVNEMARFCHELDIDLWDVISAASTKPFGFQPFFPGPGVGGHCIPIDPNYLSYQVERSLGYPFRFVELAEEINNSMPRYVVERVTDLLNKERKSVNGAKVLLLGVTYKADIADQRESPAQPIAELLDAKGANLSFHDPKVATWKAAGQQYNCLEDLNGEISNFDIVVLLQKHSNYDADALSRQSRLFFDTRGVTTGETAHRL